LRLGARALLGLFDAISLAVAIVVIVESGADYFVFVRVFVRIFVRTLAALLRRHAPAAPIFVVAIFFSAVAVLLVIESGAEDLAAARTRLVAEAQITPILIVAIVLFAVAVVRGIVPGAYDVVFRKWATGPEGAGGAGLCGNQPVCRVHPTILHQVISRR